jgi:hypothetical protein
MAIILLFTTSDYHFGILWPLYYLTFYLRLLITTLVSCDHCIICPSIYGFWLPLWYLVTIVLSDLLFTACDYHFGILWPLYYLSYLHLLITTLVSCGHCIICPSIYGFWLPLWFLVAILLSVLLFTASDYHFGIFWPLYYLSSFRNACTKSGSLRFSQFSGCWLILSVYILMILTFPLQDCSEFGNFVIALIYGFRLPLWCLQSFLSILWSIFYKTVKIVKSWSTLWRRYIVLN